MAHRLYDTSWPEMETKTQQRFRLSMPKHAGKFGVSLFIGGKEVFVGLAVADVEVEQVIRKRAVKTRPSAVKVFRFD